LTSTEVEEPISREAKLALEALTAVIQDPLEHLLGPDSAQVAGGAGPGSLTLDGVGPGSYATATDVASEKVGRTYGSLSAAVDSGMFSGG